MRAFGEVEHHPGPNVASDETYTQNILDIYGSFPAPVSALLLLYSFHGPTLLLSSSYPTPTQLLPSFCSALLYSAQLCSCPVCALLQPCSCFSPALALLQSCSCPAGLAHPSLAAFIIFISTLQLFSSRREPPLVVLLEIPFSSSVEIHRG